MKTIRTCLHFLVLSIVLLLLGCAVMKGGEARADEKTDLQKELAFYQERMGRLQAEFELARRDFQQAQQKLQGIIEKEEAEKKRQAESSR